MSKIYSIEAELDLAYDYDNIKKLLKSGEKIGFIYYEVKIFDLPNGPIVSADQAANYIYIKYPKNDCNTSIDTIYEDNDFFFAFYKSNLNQIKVSLDINAPDRFTFINSNHNEIDYSYFVSILLKICKEFKIKSLEASADY